MSETLLGWVSNLQEPKRLNRYELLLEDALRLTCNSCSIPSIDVDNVDVHRMHTKYKVSGSKVTYGDVDVNFYDFVDNLDANALYEWHREVFDVSTSLMGYPKNYKRDITLLIYGPDHSIIESWLFKGAWPKSVKRSGSLDWSNGNGMQEVQLTLSVDAAILTLS